MINTRLKHIEIWYEAVEATAYKTCQGGICAFLNNDAFHQSWDSAFSACESEGFCQEILKAPEF